MNALILVLILQVLDIITTMVALQREGLAEGNPYIKKLMDKIGVIPALLLIKGAFIAFLLWAYPLVPEPVLWMLAAFYVWVIYNNVKLIRSVK